MRRSLASTVRSLTAVPTARATVRARVVRRALAAVAMLPLLAGAVTPQASASTRAVPTYPASVQIVPLPAGWEGTAAAINHDGVILGDASHGTGWRQAFRYDTNTRVLTWLDELPGGRDAYAADINASGVAVGSATSSQGHDHAVSWDASGAITDLGVLPGDDASYAKGINAGGVIVGDSYHYVMLGGHPSPFGRAFRWDPATHVMTDIGTPGSATETNARGINDAGTIVGSTYGTGGTTEAFSRDAATGVLTGLGSLGHGSWATGINDVGAIVGFSQVDGSAGSHGFLRLPGATTLTDLGALGDWSEANAISDRGLILGTAGMTSSHHILLRTTSDSAWTDLGRFGSNAANARDLNDSGTIVGSRLDPATHRVMPFFVSPAVVAPVTTIAPATTVPSTTLPSAPATPVAAAPTYTG